MYCNLLNFIDLFILIRQKKKKKAKSISLSELEPLIYFCPIKISGSYFPMIDSVPEKISKSKSKMLSAVSAAAEGRGLKETEDESRDLFFCQSRPVP